MPTTNIIRVEERIRRREEEKRLPLIERRKRERELKMRRDMSGPRKATMGQMGQKPIGKSLVPGMTKAQEFKKRYGK